MRTFLSGCKFVLFKGLITLNMLAVTFALSSSVGIADATLQGDETITATLQVPQGAAEGVVTTQGGRFAGWGLVVLDGRPVWSYKRTQQEQGSLRIESSDKLTPGTHTLVLRFDYAGRNGEVGREEPTFFRLMALASPKERFRQP